MSSIAKQLGLDYLKADPQRSSQQSPPNTTGVHIESLLVYGRPIIKELALSGGAGRLHPIISKLNIPIAAALEVVELMETEGLVAVTDRDVTGNLDLRLTKRGERLVD